MKKRKKTLSLRRETLRVEQVLGNVVGGWQTQQQNCGPTDIGRDSECNLCGDTNYSVCGDFCTLAGNCDSFSPCWP